MELNLGLVVLVFEKERRALKYDIMVVLWTERGEMCDEVSLCVIGRGEMFIDEQNRVYFFQPVL